MNYFEICFTESFITRAETYRRRDEQFLGGHKDEAYSAEILEPRTWTIEFILLTFLTRVLTGVEMIRKCEPNRYKLVST